MQTTPHYKPHQKRAGLTVISNEWMCAKYGLTARVEPQASFWILE